MKITNASSTDSNELSDFIRMVFDTSVANFYTEKGNNEFYKYITQEAIENHLQNDHWILKAEIDKKSVGVIEIRSNNHLSMLFVHPKHQRQGIGRHLLVQAIKIIKQNNSLVKLITVHSSPNSVLAYEALGFKSVSDEKEVNGIKFTTMEMKIPE